MGPGSQSNQILEHALEGSVRFITDVDHEYSETVSIAMAIEKSRDQQGFTRYVLPILFVFTIFSVILYLVMMSKAFMCVHCASAQAHEFICGRIFPGAAVGPAAWRTRGRSPMGPT